MERRSVLLKEVDVRRRRNEVGDGDGIKVGSFRSFLICTLCHHCPKGGIGQMYLSPRLFQQHRWIQIKQPKVVGRERIRAAPELL